MMLPPWLESLLSTTFFTGCSIHGASARSECNMYCLDCAGTGAFCIYCRETMHPHHNVIQIRRSSYHDVVRVGEIQRFLDVGGVQTYVINNARVLFLNERPQPRGGAAAAGKAAGGRACEVCGRSLLDSSRFCSLGCKVAAIKNNRNLHLIHGAAAAAVVVEKEEEKRHLKIYRSTSPPPRTTSNARRRKGIPQRAPMGT
ncbi:hypothetical protein EJ110_NYTH38077 [Nymphaea thermarum]|nr:hypothetical protein EJ110_NYTH38077 [Nymphaea thermarum]